LSRAWYLRCSSEHDADQEASKKQEAMILTALQVGAPAQTVNVDALEDAWGWEDASPALMPAISSFEETHVRQLVVHVLLAGPEKFAAAGRAFWALRRPVLAAQSFTDAVRTCTSVQKVLTSTRVDLCKKGCKSFVEHVCEQETSLSRLLKSKAQSFARDAAHCWLLVAEGMDCATVSRAEALRCAELQFQAAGERWMSIVCTVQRQRFLNAFRYLADCAEMELARSRLGLISVAMRQAISRADANLAEASCLSLFFAEQELAAASRVCLLLCLSFRRVSERWLSRSRMQTRWITLVQNSLGQARWSYLVATLGNPGPHNQRLFWSHLGLIVAKSLDQRPAPSWDAFALVLF